MLKDKSTLTPDAPEGESITISISGLETVAMELIRVSKTQSSVSKSKVLG